MDISLAGLIGAFAGTFIAGVHYHLFIGVIERRLRAADSTMTAEQRDGAEAKLSLIRRVILTVDLFVFAAVGYWLGKLFWD